MQILSIQTLCLGKFLNGIFVTVVHMAALKMINETIPVYLLFQLGSSIQTCGAFGYLIVFGLGLGLPQNDYIPGMISRTNELAK